jgi:hypothetical protein
MAETRISGPDHSLPLPDGEWGALAALYRRAVERYEQENSQKNGGGLRLAAPKTREESPSMTLAPRPSSQSRLPREGACL